MEENVAKFSENLKELLAMAKKKRMYWSIRRSATFSAIWNWMRRSLIRSWISWKQNNVDVLRITDDDDDSNIILSDEDDVDVEQIDLSVPDGVSIEDPVRMYLKRDR